MGTAGSRNRTRLSESARTVLGLIRFVNGTGSVLALAARRGYG